MNRQGIIYLLIAGLLLCSHPELRSQVFIDNYLVNQLDHYSKNDYQESVMLVTDRDLYFAGDEIHISIFLMEGRYNIPMALSKVVAIELLDAVSQPMIRQKFELDNSSGAGTLDLPASLPTGNYLLRAYTNWMRNDAPSAYFHMIIPVINPKLPAQNFPSGMKEVANIEFHPEGGILIDGFESKIVTRITNRYHQPLGDSWPVVSDKGDSVATVQVDKNGFGSFYLIPETGTSYGIEFNDSLYLIQRAAPLGVALKVIKTDTTIDFRIATGRSEPEHQAYTLFVHQRGEIGYLEKIQSEDHLYSGSLPISSLPGGVSEICLIDNHYNLLASRLFIIDKSERKSFSFTTDKSVYRSRDTIIIRYSGEIGSLVTGSTFMPASGEGGPIAGDESTIFETETESGIWETNSRDNLDNILIFAGPGRNGYSKIVRDKPLKFLPEIRGQIISGSVVNGGRDRLNTSPVYIANLGIESDVQKIDIRADGTFFIAPGEYKKPANFIFLNNSREKLSIIINPEFSNEYADYTVPVFKADSLWMSRVNKLMLAHQISMIYKPEKKVTEHEHKNKFYGETDQSINLNEYVNLPVMEEFFRELLNLTIFTREQGELKLLVLSKYTNRIIGPNPLYLVDGIPLFETKNILNLNPEKIKSIHVRAQKYIYGNMMMDGIIDIESLAGDGSILDLRDGTARYRYQPSSSLDNSILHHINFSPFQANYPDTRTRLNWQPPIRIDKGGTGEIRFKASDVQGEYLVKFTVVDPGGKMETHFRVLTVE